MDQREAMIAAIRAQVEKEKAEKEAKLKKEQALSGNDAASSAASGGGKPQFKTLSAEDLQRLEEKKRRKQAGEDVGNAVLEQTSSAQNDKKTDTVKKEKTEAAKEIKTEATTQTENLSASSAGLGGGIAGSGLGGVPAGESLASGSTGESLQGGSLSGGLGAGLGSTGLGGGLDIPGLNTSPSGKPVVTSIQEDSFASAGGSEQANDWVASSDKGLPTIETPVPQKNVDDDGNLISVVPIKKASADQDVKSMYNIDFDEDEDDTLKRHEAEDARKKAEAIRAAEEAKKAEEAEAAKIAEAARKAEELKAQDEAARKQAEEAARAAAIEATQKADEEARKAAKKSAENEAIRKAKEEAAKRKAAEEAKKKAAEEAARAAYSEELQAKAATANRRLDSAVQKVITANNKVAALQDQDQNHTKYVEEELAKIDARTEDQIVQVKNAEADRVKDVEISYNVKRQELDAEYAAKAEQAAKDLEAEKKEKAARLEEIKQEQKDKKIALEQKNLADKDALKQEEIDRKNAINEAEEKAKADLEHANEGERQQLEASIRQDAKVVEDALNEVKANAANADNLIQAAMDHVAELERQIEEAKAKVEQERQNKAQAESLIAAKEDAVAAQKAKAEAQKSELENRLKDKALSITAEYDTKREQLVSEYVDKQNRLVEDYNGACARVDTETEDLLERTQLELSGLDAKADANKGNLQAGLDARKQELQAEEASAVAKAKEQTQSEIDACRQQGEQEKNAYITKSNDEVENVRIQLKEAKDEAASMMQVYEITRRSAIEAMESAKRLGIAVSMPALDMEIPKGAVPASATKASVRGTVPKQPESAASDAASQIPASMMEFMAKYLDVSQTAGPVRKALQEVVNNPTANKNILVLGKHGFGSTIVGNDFARALYAAGICSSKTIANIKSAALNKRSLESVKDKLKGGCLVVENAGTLTVDRMQEIARTAKDPANDITVIFTGEKDRVQYVIKDAGIADLFAHTVMMTEVDEDGMVTIANGYARQLGYTVDDSAQTVLKNKLKEIEDGNLDRYLKMVDDAVEKAKAQGENTHLAGVDFN